LTNIIRDVHEDYKLGRVYLPEEDLQRTEFHGRLRPERSDSRRSRIAPLRSERTWQLYEEGSALLGLIDADSRGALWLLVHTYSALLSRIESSDLASSASVCGFPKRKNDVHRQGALRPPYEREYP